ncbi:hypothetical protein [Helicobacter sp. 11S02596-1]|uniref:hypothetical protein n=1 Tax=Helicobacter sp. 11S02596-1 TaxID=1476194 RepID=UPI000BA5FFD4|nr:hypothetical protein [Helicobacter sp. 11S02596-1]PAF42779.1 hypothetical protein BJI48_05830 [Helicobacter sp. 11S02596-1]
MGKIVSAWAMALCLCVATLATEPKNGTNLEQTEPPTQEPQTAENTKNQPKSEAIDQNKWNFLARSVPLAIYFGKQVYAINVVPLEIGANYNILDRLSVGALIGFGLQTTIPKALWNLLQDPKAEFSIDDSPYLGAGMFIPMEIIVDYAITNFAKRSKNISIYAGAGYDFSIYNYGAGYSKLRFDIGIQFGRLGFRFSWVPYMGSDTIKLNGQNFGLAFAYQYHR